MILVFNSCDTELDIDYPDHSSILVVEGWIDQDEGAIVLLTLSAPYFSDIDSNNLLDYAVRSAKVSVISTEGEEVLTLKPSSKYFPPYYYFGTEIKGELMGEYSLEVDYRGIQYTANTSIPDLVEPDSVWFERVGSDTLGNLKLKLSDDVLTTNYYRTLTQIKGSETKFSPTLTSLFTDEQFNGKTVELSLLKGSSTVLDFSSDSMYYAVGDTIILRFCSIDKAHYDFWNTVESQSIASSNPFSVNNSNVESNVDNAIGIWGGYSVFYDTIIAK